jgi:hypothetical protein
VEEKSQSSKLNVSCHPSPELPYELALKVPAASISDNAIVNVYKAFIFDFMLERWAGQVNNEYDTRG